MRLLAALTRGYVSVRMSVIALDRGDWTAGSARIGLLRIVPAH